MQSLYALSMFLTVGETWKFMEMWCQLSYFLSNILFWFLQIRQAVHVKTPGIPLKNKQRDKIVCPSLGPRGPISEKRDWRQYLLAEKAISV